MSVCLIRKMLCRKRDKRKLKRTFKVRSMLDIIKKMRENAERYFDN